MANWQRERPLPAGGAVERLRRQGGGRASTGAAALKASMKAGRSPTRWTTPPKVMAGRPEAEAGSKRCSGSVERAARGWVFAGGCGERERLAQARVGTAAEDDAGHAVGDRGQRDDREFVVRAAWQRSGSGRGGEFFWGKEKAPRGAGGRMRDLVSWNAARRGWRRASGWAHSPLRPNTSGDRGRFLVSCAPRGTARRSAARPKVCRRPGRSRAPGWVRIIKQVGMPRSQKGAVFCFSAHLHVIWRGSQELGAPRRRLAPLVRHSPASQEALRHQRLRRRRGPAQRRPAGASMPQRLAQHRRLLEVCWAVTRAVTRPEKRVGLVPANEQRKRTRL